MKTKKQNVHVVIPTIRTLDFLNDWEEQFTNCTIHICEDHLKQEIETPKVGKAVYHYTWKDIDADLKKDGWIIPRKVSGIRNYGFLQAYRAGATHIITIDDDCYPVAGHHLVVDHLRNLSLRVPSRWTNTNPDVRHLYTRGIPYLVREEQPVVLSHGVWTNVLDHDGPTHLQHLSFRSEFAEHFLTIIPTHAYFPLCSMNIAFKTEITPLMYFPLMGEDTEGKKWGYDRFDDIWCGFFAKKILDHLKLGVVNGSPMVEHRKASDPFKNLQKEAAGIEVNEELWKAVDAVTLHSTTPIEAYKELAEKISFPKSDYFSSLRSAMSSWAELF